MKRLLSVIAILALVGSTSCKTGNPGQESAVGEPLTLTARQDFPFQYFFETGGEGTYEVSGLPTWLSFDPATGGLSGTPLPSGSVGGLVVKVTSGGVQRQFNVTFDITGDTFASEQWGLENLGQTAYSKNGGSAGADIRAKEAHRLGALGASVSVFVSDTGLELTHEDLAAGVLTGKSKNYNTSAPFYGTPVNPSPSKGDHGTSVAGIIAARGWNGIGVRGVAPEAKVAAGNFLSSKVTTAILIDQASEDPNNGANYSIFNYSYGYDSLTLQPAASDYLDQLLHGALNQRESLGSIYVKSAGNSYDNALEALDGNGNKVTVIRNLPSVHDEENNQPWTIVVGALNAAGVQSSYSSAGSCVLVSAPGGEDAFHNPAIVTTDVSGCVNGYSPSFGSLNSFERGQKGNTSCNYTSAFNGTSSAAPHVSGVVALMLSARPTLTWRDVRDILIRTSDQVDPTRGNKTATVGGSPVITEDGWKTNAAGLKYSPVYGFGRVNAARAVETARTYTSTFGALKMTVTPSGNCPSTPFCSDDTWLFTSGAINLNIADNNAAGQSNAINVTSDFVIEAVQVRVRMDTDLVADIGIRLTSPSGTVGNILDPQSATLDQDIDHRFISHLYYGERSQGTWTIQVMDAATGGYGASTPSTLNDWAINIIGHDP